MSHNGILGSSAIRTFRRYLLDYRFGNPNSGVFRSDCTRIPGDGLSRDAPKINDIVLSVPGYRIPIFLICFLTRRYVRAHAYSTPTPIHHSLT